MGDLALEMEKNITYLTPLLDNALKNLEKGFNQFISDPTEVKKLSCLLKDFAGRETALHEAKNLGKLYNGKIFLKREDLVHGGAHKLNNAIAQCSLAKFMGIKNVIAETGAGQHGVATAMACANLKLSLQIFQGEIDVQRQYLNALRMKLFGAHLIPVTDGSKKLKEAVNAAMRFWVANYQNHFYCLGSIVGPHPYPSIVRHFQKVIGNESRKQILEKTSLLPSAIFACIGGGSNAAGIFSAFVSDESVKLVGCEAAGAASLSHGAMGVLHGMETFILQTSNRQIAETHSISAGLDYPAVGPWLAGLKQENRLQTQAILDEECIQSLNELATEEGILCALESAHAVAGAKKYLANNPGETIIICLSGRGDKDLDTISNFKNKSELK
ncbi:tryptophan synthase subunit beta [Pigmentibacter ruber]|nr:tryptophan synthase subunit beta [Pigmentibacter ruber]